MMLLLKNLLFTLVVPGTVAVYIPLLISQNRTPPVAGPLFAIALAVLALGGAVYAWCVWDFATFGQGHARADRCAQEACRPRAVPLHAKSDVCGGTHGDPRLDSAVPNCGFDPLRAHRGHLFPPRS